MDAQRNVSMEVFAAAWPAGNAVSSYDRPRALGCSCAPDGKTRLPAALTLPP